MQFDGNVGQFQDNEYCNIKKNKKLNKNTTEV